VLNALDVPCDMDAAYVSKFQTLQDWVIGSTARTHVVLIIDEAQNLSIEGLEELRMLTNINSNKDELLQLILVGQPELREMITRHELRQFAQRVTASFHISALDGPRARARISATVCSTRPVRARNSPTGHRSHLPIGAASRA
jgi:general secretion pathway protein A